LPAALLLHQVDFLFNFFPLLKFVLRYCVLATGAQIALVMPADEESRREVSLLGTVVDFDFLRDAGIRIRGKESRARGTAPKR